MKRVCALSVLLAVVAAATELHAEIPRTLTYQGVFTDTLGSPRPDGLYTFTFRLYETSSGGTAIWTEVKDVQIERGLFSTTLGDAVPFGSSVAFDRPYWLGVEPGTEPELTPRIPLSAAAYSMRAARSDTAQYALAIASNATASARDGALADSSSWSLTGNAGTMAGINFVGTTDAQAFDIRTNNLLRTRITTKGQLETHNTGQSVFLGEGAGANDDLTINQNTFVGYQAGFFNTTGFANAANGRVALLSNTTGSYNTASGVQALLSNTAGNYNTASGFQALHYNVAGSNATAVGTRAMFNANNTATPFTNDNVAVGYEALRGSTSPSANTGHSNTAIGYQTLWSNTTGNYNTANGVVALLSNTTGTFNTASGFAALDDNTTGSQNTASGYAALTFNTTGGYNTAFGSGALYHNNTGNCNTALGKSSFFTGTSFSNSTALGYNAGITTSNQVRVGNSSVTSIGGFAGWTNLSDMRFKKNVQENVKGLEFIMKLRPITYNLDTWKLAEALHEDRMPDESGDVTTRQPDAFIMNSRNEKARIVQSGFVAQDVEKAAKEVGYDFSGVDAPKNENDFYGLRYAEFVVPLVKAVQEQQNMIDELRKEMRELKNKK
jgi:hypothetical protein